MCHDKETEAADLMLEGFRWAIGDLWQEVQLEDGNLWSETEMFDHFRDISCIWKMRKQNAIPVIFSYVSLQ